MTTKNSPPGLAVVDAQALTQALYAELAQWQAKAMGQRNFVIVGKAANVPAQLLADATKLADVYEETGARLFAAIDRIAAAAKGQRSASEAASTPAVEWPSAATTHAQTAENVKLKPQDRYVALVSLVEALSKLTQPVTVATAQRLQRLYDDVTKLCPSLDDVAASIEKVRLEWPGAGGVEAVQRDEELTRLRGLCAVAQLNRNIVSSAELTDPGLAVASGKYSTTLDEIRAKLATLPYPGGIVQAQAEATIAELRRLRGDCVTITKLRRIVAEAK